MQLIAAAYLVTLAVWLTPAWARVLFVVGVLSAKLALLVMVPHDWLAAQVALRPPEGSPVGPGTWAHFDGVKQLVNMEHVAVATLASRLIGWFGMAQQYLPLATIGVIGAWTATLLDARRTWGAWAAVTGIGTVLTAAAFAMQWGYVAEGGGLLGLWTVPFSKWFFSPAYCLLAAGTGVLMLTAFFAVVDLLRWTDAWALRVMGVNALAIYVGAELSFKTIFSKWLVPLPDGGSDSIAGAVQAWLAYATGSPAAGSLGMALLWVTLWWAVAWWLDARKIYLKV